MKSSHAQPNEQRLLFLVRDSRYFLSHRLSLAIAAKEAGYDVGVGCAFRREDEVEKIQTYGISIFHVPFIDDYTHKASLLKSILACWSSFKCFRPSIVHAITIKAIILGAALSLGQRWIFVGLFAGLGTLFRNEKPIYKLLAPFISLLLRAILGGKNVSLVFMNEDDRNLFLKWVHLTQSKAIIIRGSGINTERFRYRSYDPMKTTRTVTMTSRLLKDKGVIEFLTAAKNLKVIYPHHSFRLVGDIDPHNPTSLRREEVECLCKDAGVDWMGHTDDIPHVLEQSDIYCLPSYHEGLSLALLEAAATGCAIVTSDIPGCRAVITHEVSGLLVTPRDSRSLEDAIARLLNSPHMASKFGMEARRKVESEFSQERVIECYLRLYRGLLHSL